MMAESPVQEQGSDIYGLLVEHQKTEAWRYRDCLTELHEWTKRFNFEFKLNTPQIVIGVGRLRRARLGQFRYGHNDLGLRGEVTIDDRHVAANAHPERWWRVLGTLLHEMVHGWQQCHGRPSKSNYHNNEFQRKAAELGLIVTRRGVTQYDPGSPFFELLERHGIRPPDLPAPKMVEADSRGGGSKLKLWVCGCPVRVRVAVARFEAQCLRCGNRFERV